jgi:hypothetical protein
LIALLLSVALAWSAPAPAPAPAPSPADAPAEGPAVTQLTASLVLEVGEPQVTGDTLVAKAKEVGGWFQVRTQDSVSLRVPSEKLEPFLAFAGAQGEVADRSYAANDLTGQLVDLRSRLSARESVLDKYYEVLASANPKAVVSVERQITNLVQEIEQLKGRIKLLEHQGAFAAVDVSFRFRDRRAPAKDGSSSFAWLNTMTLEDLVSDFQRPEAWRKSSPAKPVAPDGFFPWKKTSRFRAVSADGVMYRVRSVKHKPKGELAFWKEALHDRMVAAGYKVASETDVTASGTPGALLELHAPLGEQDWTYLVGVFPDGGKLVLVEAGAEITDFQQHEQAILDAIGKMSL